jgi:hypothetical protein
MTDCVAIVFLLDLSQISNGPAPDNCETVLLHFGNQDLGFEAHVWRLPNLFRFSCGDPLKSFIDGSPDGLLCWFVKQPYCFRRYVDQLKAVWDLSLGDMDQM